ncbi:MAG: hypothetical protein IJ783_08640, partial [Kiritimatiellae bacterium]|nr:hypothetical protein [Kiritimatiellia bacterium]
APAAERPAPEAERPTQEPARQESPVPRFRFVGALSTGYAIVETEGGGFAAVDPSAAHERVAYERLLANANVSDPPAQGLLVPQTAVLQPVDAQRVRSLLPTLAEMGFEVEDFGGDTFAVRSMPEPVKGASAKELLEDASRAFAEAGPKKARARWREELVAAAAAKLAVRGRERMDARQWIPLLLELAACRMPYATPSGRPTMVHFPAGDLERRFGR